MTRTAPSLRGAMAVALLLSLPMIALQLAGPDARLALRYDALAVDGGDWWRLWTAHALHLSPTHLAMNLAGLVLCAALAPEAFQPRALPRLLTRLLVLATAVSLGLWLGSPQVPDYVGFSGVLYGLFLWTLAPAALRGDASARLTLVGLAGWAAWQQLAGPLAMEATAIGGSIVTVAHLYGLAAAAIGLAIDALHAGIRRATSWRGATSTSP